MRKALSGLVVVSLALLALPAWAQTSCGRPICFTFAPAAQSFFAAAGVTQQQVEDRLNLELGKFFQTTDTAGFVRKFGDAQSFTSKSLGVDYASEATIFEVGAAGSVAMGMDRTYQPGGSSAGFPISGVGMNASLMGGLGLGFLGVPVMVFGNWMRVPEQEYGQMRGKLDNWGLHAQLRLFGPTRGMSALKMLVRWGGIAITTGVDSSHMNLRLGQKFSTKNIPLSSIAGSTSGSTIALANASGAVGGTARMEVDLTTRSIPLEFTTSLRLLTLVTVYGGVGLDWQLGGSSNMDVKLSGAMSGTVGGATTNLGTAEVEVHAKASPSAAKLRGIAGVQLNMFLLRLFAQINAANTNPVMASAAFGARVAF